MSQGGRYEIRGDGRGDERWGCGCRGGDRLARRLGAVAQYVNALTLAGIACLMLAFMTVGGHWTITRSPNYVLSE